MSPAEVHYMPTMEGDDPTVCGVAALEILRGRYGDDAVSDKKKVTCRACIRTLISQSEDEELREKR